MSNFARNIISLQSGSILPSEYKQVNYIQNTGTQYISTGQAIGSGYKVELLIEPTFVESDFLWGTVNSLDEFNGMIGSGWRIRVGDWGTFVGTVAKETKYKVFFSFGSSRSIIVDDTYSYTGSSWTSSNSTIIDIGRCRGSNLTREAAKWYSVKLYDNSGNLTHDFYPCYRKSDKEVGFYDLVTEGFFSNSGTGSFLYG